MRNALIFDCDGVLADTERYGHLPAFNQVFREFGLPIHWSEDEYGDKLRIAGGKERMASLLTAEFVAKAGLPTDPDAQNALIQMWHKRKTEIYRQSIRDGRLPGRPGVRRIMHEARSAGWRLAVASTSAEEAVRGVLEHVVGKDVASDFLVLAGDIVPRKKPAPDIYKLALQELGGTPDRSLVIEDSRSGLVAARAAGVRCVITLSSYTWGEDMSEALLVVSDLGEPNAPMRIVANRSRAEPGRYVTLKDLESCLYT